MYFLLKVSFSLSVGNALYLFIYVDFNFFLSLIFSRYNFTFIHFQSINKTHGMTDFPWADMLICFPQAYPFDLKVCLA
jgi:hypothetical protein